MSKYFNENEKSQSSSINNGMNENNKNIFQKFKFYYNVIKNKIIIYQLERWIVIAFLILIYIIRIIQTKGYYFITYTIAIHILNGFILFISPFEDPEENQLCNNDSFLPQKNNEEFKPFQRRLREYTFWSIVLFTFIIGIIVTFFERFNIPIYWPILVLYFIAIFIFEMRKQIKKMIKYHYFPWDVGKMKYGK